MPQKKELTWDEVVELMQKLKKLDEEGYTEEEAAKILGIDPTKSPIL